VENGGHMSPWPCPQLKKEGDPSPKYLTGSPPPAPRAPNWSQSLEAGKIPLVLGGDHSVAAGTVSGVAESTARHKTIGSSGSMPQRHHTPGTSPSGNVHGMPLAASWASAF